MTCNVVEFESVSLSKRQCYSYRLRFPLFKRQSAVEIENWLKVCLKFACVIVFNAINDFPNRHRMWMPPSFIPLLLKMISPWNNSVEELSFTLLHLAWLGTDSGSLSLLVITHICPGQTLTVNGCEPSTWRHAVLLVVGFSLIVVLSMSHYLRFEQYTKTDQHFRIVWNI